MPERSSGRKPRRSRPLRWDDAPVSGRLSKTLKRRQRALARMGRTPAERNKAPAHVPLKRKVGGQPRLDWALERKVAVFLMVRQLQGRVRKNSLIDAQAYLEREHDIRVSRPTVFRILRRHREAALWHACAHLRFDRKKFKQVVPVRKRMAKTDFDTWSPDLK